MPLLVLAPIIVAVVVARDQDLPPFYSSRPQFIPIRHRPQGRGTGNYNGTPDGRPGPLQLSPAALMICLVIMVIQSVSFRMETGSEPDSE